MLHRLIFSIYGAIIHNTCTMSASVSQRASERVSENSNIHINIPFHILNITKLWFLSKVREE